MELMQLTGEIGERILAEHYGIVDERNNETARVEQERLQAEAEAARLAQEEADCQERIATLLQPLRDTKFLINQKREEWESSFDFGGAFSESFWLGYAAGPESSERQILDLRLSLSGNYSRGFIRTVRNKRTLVRGPVAIGLEVFDGKELTDHDLAIFSKPTIDENGVPEGYGLLSPEGDPLNSETANFVIGALHKAVDRTIEANLIKIKLAQTPEAKQDVDIAV